MPTEIGSPWLIVGGIALWFGIYTVYRLIRGSKK